MGTAALQQIALHDQWLMRRVERWRAPRWIRRWMLLASRAGDGVLWYAAGVLILLQGGPERWSVFGAAAMAAGLAIASFEGLKHGFRRGRPCVSWACGAAPPKAPDRYSFPSGHTLTAFAIAMPLMHAYPRIEPLLLFCAVNIAISRILLGLHFLTDVLAGSALGCGVGYLASTWLLHLR